MPQAPLPPGFTVIAEPYQSPESKSSRTPVRLEGQDYGSSGENRTGSQVAKDQAHQAYRGMVDYVSSFSPFRARGGSPTVEMPEAFKGIGSLLSHPIDAVHAAVQPISTVLQGLHSMINPSVPAPSQQEWERATHDAAGALTGLLSGYNPGTIYPGQEYMPPENPAGPSTGTEPPPMDVPPRLNAPSRQKALTTPPAAAPRQLNAGPTAMESGSEGAPIEPDPRLPAAYARIPVAGPKPPPGVMGGANFGQEGSLPPKPHADVTGSKPMLVRAFKGDKSGYVPGQIRPEMLKETEARLTNFGRSVTRRPGADAQPYVPPKPTPPPRAKK